MCGSSSDGGSNWEPEPPAFCLKRAKAARQAKHASPAIQSFKAAAASMHRTAQRKKVIVTASNTHCISPWLWLAEVHVTAQSARQASQKLACFSMAQHTRA